MIGTTNDLARWARALYTGRLLPPQQQAELTSLVSTATGQPIEQTSPSDPNGFGLGVGQLTIDPLGTFWVYEGSTFGFRVLHIYLPESGVTVAVGLNSHTGGTEITALAEAVFDTLITQGVLAPVGAGA
jgi:D-alanyl-D-alanine carboxypeptidase